MQHLNIWMLPGSFLLGLAWFLPNTYQPWLSAWQETAAMMSVLILCIAAWQVARSQRFSTSITLSFPLTVVVLLVLFSLIFQVATDVIFFSGDAIMVAAYLMAWLLAAYAGQAIARSGAQNIDIFIFTVLLSAAVSIGLALVQWLGVEGLNIFVLDIPLGGRPFANLGQPNNFCTLCFLGCASLLYFYERGMVRGTPFWLAWCWLSFGMALSQSRTGLVQMACLVFGLWWFGRRIQLRLNRSGLIVLSAILAIWVAVLPSLASGLFISVERTLGDQMQSDIRLQYWLSMLSAISNRPWTGYGWLQTGLAQQLENSASFNSGIFDFSHNILLDIVIWVGIPVGLSIVSCAMIWLISAGRYLNSGTSAAIFIAILGILVHSMLEYPLAYAYFLIPFGFLMGALHGLCRPNNGMALSRRAMKFFFFGVMIFFICIAYDYFLAETVTRDLRFESSHIAPKVNPVEIPEMLLLNQIRDLMRYGYRDPDPNISEEAWVKTGIVAERYGFSFVMFRYALASAFRNKYTASQETLHRLCRIHSIQKCQSARFEWRLLSKRYPESVGKINFPDDLIMPANK